VFGDGEIARNRREGLDQLDIIGSPVGAILVGADIDPHNATVMRACGQPPQHRFGAVIVETHAIDDALVTLQPEQPRPWISGLWTRRHRADFDKAEAEPQQGIGHFRALVETRRHADRIGKVQAERPHRKFRIVRLRPDRRQQFQALDCHPMGIFRVEPAQERQRKGVEGADHGASSGMS
jgi:hypothetical protein